MDIREFYKQTKDNQPKNTNDSSNTSAKDEKFGNSNQDFSAYQDTINKYKDLSQEQLYSELLTQASDLKAQGKLNTDMLQQISTTLTPMLNDKQKNLLNNIMNKLK